MRNPWLGLAAYEEPQEGKDNVLFCGRSTAIRALTSLIQQNLFVTLYGMTGVGKTSLLRAGVFPKLRKDGYTPIMIRLNDVPEDKSYITYVLEKMVLLLKKQGVNCYPYQKNGKRKEKTDEKGKNGLKISVEAIDTPQKLRLFFATHVFKDSKGNITYPVVVIDQFEESIYRNFRKASDLMDLLHSLVDNTIYFPAIEAECHVETNYRFVVSIREDDLFLMEDIVDERGLNCFKQNRYRLRSLTQEEASEVVLNPGKGYIKEDEEKEVSNHLITLSTENGHINTLSLSLFCSLLFERANESPITEKMAAEISSDSLANFYKNAVSRLPKKERVYIESNLIDAVGRRDSVSSRQMEEHAPHAELLLDDKTRILQQVNGRVEFVHDLLAKCVYNLRHEERRSIWRMVSTIGLIVGLLVILSYSFMSSFKNPLPYEDPYMEYVSPEVLKVPDGYSVVSGLKQTVQIISNYDVLEVRDCPVLKTVTLNSKSYRRLEFRDCPSLIEVNLPSDCESVLLDISNCPNLGPIKLGAEIRHLIVVSKDKLSFDISPENKFLKWEKGILYAGDNEAVVYAIPEISEWKMAHISQQEIKYKEEIIENIENKSLEDLLIINGETLMGIKDPFFSGRLDLSSFVHVREIEKNAFKDVKGITSIVLPDSIQVIGSCAFAGLDSIESVYFPSSLSDIGNFAFAGCTNLSQIVFGSTSVFPASNSFIWCDNAVFSVNDSVNNLILPDSINRRKYIDIRDNIIYNLYYAFESMPLGTPWIFGKNVVISKEDLNFLKRISLYTLDGYYGAGCYFPPSLRFTENAKENRKCREMLSRKPAYCHGEIAIAGEFKPLLAIKDTVCRELRLNCATPSYPIDNGIRIYGFIQYIPDHIKRNITLIVPWGCKDNYLGNPDFQGFKEIKEGSVLERLIDVFFSQIGTSKIFIFHHFWALALVVGGMLVVIILFFSLNWLSISKDASKINRSKLYKWIHCLLATLGMLSLCIFAFVAGYAFVAFVAHLHDVIWKILGGIVLVAVCYVVVYANILFNVFSHGFLNGLKDIYGTLKEALSPLFSRLFRVVSLPNNLIAIGLFILSASLVIGLRLYEGKKHAQWLYQIDQLRGEGKNIESYAMVRSIQKRTFPFFYPEFSDSLKNIRNSIASDSTMILKSIITPNKENWVKLSPDGHQVFLHSENGDSKILNWISGESILIDDEFSQYRQDFTNAEFNTSGNRLAIHYYHDSAVNIYSAKSGQKEYKIPISYSTSNDYPMYWLDDNKLAFDNKAFTLSIVDVENESEYRKDMGNDYMFFKNIGNYDEGRLVYLNEDHKLEILEIAYDTIMSHPTQVKIAYRGPKIIAVPGIFTQRNSLDFVILDADTVISRVWEKPIVRNGKMIMVMGKHEYPNPDKRRFLESCGVEYKRLPMTSDHMECDSNGRIVLVRFSDGDNYRYELYDVSSDIDERLELLDSIVNTMKPAL